MITDINILLVTALSLGFVHTIIGPDHYLPFVVMAKSGKWTMKKTMIITFLSGSVHVLGSILLGFLGIAVGSAINGIEAIESIRGELASWVLISFGLIYMVWGIRQSVKSRKHSHFHVHEDGAYHIHKHHHQEEHSHIHSREDFSKLTPWILFTIFVLGPCESLIPLLMYPAAQGHLVDLFLVAGLFALATVVTMVIIVFIGAKGLSLLPMHALERHIHSLAGGMVLLSGLLIQFGL